LFCSQPLLKEINFAGKKEDSLVAAVVVEGENPLARIQLGNPTGTELGVRQMHRIRRRRRRRGSRVLKFRRILPGPHRKIVTPVFAGSHAALVVNVAVEVDDVVDFDGGGKGSGVFQRFPVNGQSLGEEKGSLVFAVQLEVDDGFVGIGDLLDHPGTVEMITM